MDLAVRRRFRRLLAAVKALGLGEGLKVLFHSRIRRAPGIFTVRVPQIKHPVYARKRTSDPNVLQQIFVDREYAPIDDEPGVRWVVDCGANVGYSSIYFLNRFPQCRVLAVEPEPGNVALLRKNLEPYGNRVDIVPAGVWSARTKLVIVPREEAWATQVRAAQSDEKGDLEAVDMTTLLHRTGAERIDLLKMDIEGSEAEVFSGDVHAWLPRVRTICMEIHGKRAEEVVLRALTAYEFTNLRSGEQWIFRNIKQKPRRFVAG